MKNMKKIILSLIVLISLVSCRGALISDEPIIVKKQVTLPTNHRYKYFYKGNQEGYKVRIYSNNEYKKGQIVKIQ